MFESLTIDGLTSEGDGCAANQISGCDGDCCGENSCASNLNTCDVIGAFIDRNDGAGEICVGWAYGGILNGGDSLSQEITFTITVRAVNDAPNFVGSDIHMQIMDKWRLECQTNYQERYKQSQV